MPDEAFLRAKSIALSRTDIVGRLVSEDGTGTAVYLTSTVPEDNPAAVKEIVAAVRALAADVQARHPSIDIRLTGLVMLDAAMAEASDRDTATLVPAMFALILLIVAVALRSATATAMTLIVIVLSVAVALGMAGWWNLKLNPATSAAPIIVITLAVANCVHILASYLFRFGRDEAKDKADAVTVAVRQNIREIAITSGTTVVAFLTLNFSGVAPFRELGNIVAVGMAAGFLPQRHAVAGDDDGIADPQTKRRRTGGRGIGRLRAIGRAKPPLDRRRRRNRCFGLDSGNPENRVRRQLRRIF